MSRRRYMHGSRRHPSHRIGWKEHSVHSGEGDGRVIKINRNGTFKDEKK